MVNTSQRLGATLLLAAATVLAGRPATAELRVTPERVPLRGPESSQQVLLTEVTSTGLQDRTRQATYRVSDSSIAVVENRGLLRPRGEGSTELLVSYGGERVRVPVEVSGIEDPEPLSFRHDIIPVLTKAGCNAGNCHGKAEGRGGFKLSIFGVDPAADYDALLKEGRGRRVNLAAPEMSLLLRKASASIPHGGGRRLSRESLHLLKLQRWVREGARFETEQAVPVARIEVTPEKRVMKFQSMQQLQVTAVDAEGQRSGVTAQAEFESNAPTIAEVDEHGLVETGDIPGEAAILVRYMGHVTVCRVTLPRPDVEFDRPPETNFIDGLVWDKLQQLGIKPSRPADDATFLRRVYLDTIGTLPTAEEARRFLDSSDSDKRSKLIDRLLKREEYADYWTLLWSDILHVDSEAITPQGAVAMTRWLRKQFARNRPYDEFAREILTARGSTQREGPQAMYSALNKPQRLSRSMSQLFLGVRIECAQCHHHPFEKWSQRDYYAFAGFFTGLKRKKLPAGDTAVYAGRGSDLKHPRTGERVPTAALGAEPADLSSVSDRRRVLAEWMTADENPYFAKMIANRLWSHYFGRGLVEPVDDLRATNPPVNEPLLNALADYMRDLDYDLKAFTRTLLNSRVYQLASQTNVSNARDRQNFSHALDRALPAEVLLDAICQTTEVPHKFSGWPVGVRAIQLWDNRMPSYFLRVFGRPGRDSVCSCDRDQAPSITQALHLMNSTKITEKVHHRHGRARRLAESDKNPDEIIEELFLATLSRYPTKRERKLTRQTFAETDRRTATEDILWALLNSREFISNH